MVYMNIVTKEEQEQFIKTVKKFIARYDTELQATFLEWAYKRIGHNKKVNINKFFYHIETYVAQYSNNNFDKKLSNHYNYIRKFPIAYWKW